MFPWVAFPAFLWSTGRLGMAAAEQIDAGEDCKRKLIGTGPFKLVEWSPNDKLVAEKNPNYWQKDENGVQLPYLDQITFQPQENTSQLVSGLKGGQYDLIHLTDGKEISRLPQGRAAGQDAGVHPFGGDRPRDAEQREAAVQQPQRPAGASRTRPTPTS